MTYKEIESEQNIWLPKEEGNQIEGIVINKTTGQYGTQLEIQTNPETIITTPSHKVLQARLGKISIGDKIRLTYKGEQPPSVKGQNPTKIYKVEKDEPEEENQIKET